ncbi:MAG: hypothetical protein EZS28_028099 [Streblomastix strix]|uniref:Uncharacterized protein n=1 Tax=Streblomastix strix TaxID=222440 RepID=A0A5J4V190_9EUKA|nr:MAG: hypothetical protein EZS28_028099 [Streblomastix strix]
MHPQIELMPRILKRLKKQPSTALFLLSYWFRDKYQSKFPSVIKQMDFGPSEMTLIEGRSMHKHLLKLSPGNHIDVLMTDMRMAWNNSDLSLLNQVKIWRKRNSGLSIMVDYLKIFDIQIDDLMNDRPQINIANAMVWVNDMGGKI